MYRELGMLKRLQVGEEYDIIGFDPRGIGQTESVYDRLFHRTR